jgi:hypothetical protein
MFDVAVPDRHIDRASSWTSMLVDRVSPRTVTEQRNVIDRVDGDRRVHSDRVLFAVNASAFRKVPGISP